MTRFWLTLLAVLGVTVPLTTVLAAPPSYWMTCMGGPSVYIGNFPDPDKAPLYGTSHMRVAVGIEPAPDMTSPLTSGQCRWLDRPLNRDEKGLAVLFWWPERSPPSQGSRRLPPGIDLIDPSARLADELLAYAKEAKPYQIRAYRDLDVMHIVNVRR